MASISTLKASSSSSNPRTYDVFLSFRGEDTRKTFTGHLYAYLVERDIHTFRDDEELEKGGDIASDLSRVIEESKIFVVIFSKHYADSKWCLDELVKIIDCKTEKGSVVLPVFYHVEPTDVRNQGGSFKDAFLEHAKDADQEKKKTIETWENALKIAANLSGYHLQNQSEAEFIQKIRGDIIIILNNMNHKPLHVGDNIVGMDFHLEQLKSLIKTELDEVHMVGICGTGGIGKTTISMAIYNDISSQFDGSSFLGNIGRKGEDYLLKLQKTLLRDILKFKRRDDEPEFSNISEGINVIKERLRLKRVLIVLDDVDNYMQLENLAGKHGWYGAKSIIIITTKDKHLLKRHEVNVVYEVQKLNHEKSAELFNWWAFKQNTPKIGFESLSNSVVKYADGLPIALKVLGGLLYTKSIDEWTSELHKLGKEPPQTVQSVLKVSYDKLDHTWQEIFLDIACFFRGKDKDFVSRILGSNAMMGIKVLNDRCLLTISENRLDMHDLVQQMGREIVRQECLKEPGNRSRIWDRNDVNSVLTRNTGTQAIEGIVVPISPASQISTNFFTKMNRLRLLKVYYPDVWEGDFEAFKNLDFPYFELRYFHFKGYPLESLPTNFHAKNLVELNLKESSIKQLWQGNEILDNLKVINLSYSEDLVEIPDFSSVPNLEILILKGCSSLKSLPINFDAIKGNMSKLREIDLSVTSIEELPSSIGRLKALQHLDLSFCENLVNLPKSICNLSSLKTLIMQECSNLKCFPEIKVDMENLKRLDLSFTGIEELPSSIGRLKALQHLDLSSCKSLRSLSESICNLSSLETLIVWGCSNLKRFPEIKDDMENLKRLDLRETGIEELSSSIGRLKALQHLDLFGCKSLRSLSESICNLSSLETLNVWGCSNLKRFLEIKDDMENLKRLDLRKTGIEELTFSIGRLKALQHLDLFGCKSLRSLWESNCNLSSLETLIVQGCSNLKRFPEIKDDMKNLKMLDLRETGIEELPSSIGRLKALQRLDLFGCKSLRSLLESICNLSFLETLIVQGCSNLKRFPEIKDDMENLKRLDLRETSIEELPSSIGRLKALQHLDLSGCKSLRNLSESICNLSSLETLNVNECPKLERWEVNLVGSSDLTFCILKQGVIWWSNCSFFFLKPLNLQHNQMEGEVLNHHVFSLSSLVELCKRNSRVRGREILSDCLHPSSLKVLSVGNFNPMERGILSDIFHHSSLKTLSLHNCNLMEEGIFTNIWNLPLLVELSLSNCNLREGEILNHICHLSSLLKLSLDGNHFSSIPANIIQLSKLMTLDLSHCQKLLQIPELPQSLRFLDAHGCPCLETLSSPSSSLGFSLFKCFKSAIEEFERGSYWSKEITVFIPGNNGIPEWIGYKKKGSEIATELPENWWEDNNFLGFALCSVFVPLHIESKEDPCLKCKMNFPHYFEDPGGFVTEFWSVDELSFRRSYPCCHNGGESNKVWVAYYPKVAIENKHWSNESRHLKASFYGERVKVEECGLHLIYKTDILNKDSNGTNHWPLLLRENTDFNVKRSLDNAQNPHNKKSRHL